MIAARLVNGTSRRNGHFSPLALVSVVGGLLGGLLVFLRDLAGELADENAYARHLSWHRRDHSREEWKAFYDSRLARKYRQGRCC